MRMGTAWPLGLLLSVRPGLACDSARQCQKALPAAANAWEGCEEKIRQTRAPSRGPGFESKSVAERTVEFEAGATLGWESFAFERITWTAASNGRKRTVEAFGRLPNRERNGAFAGTMSLAKKRHTKAEAACR